MDATRQWLEGEGFQVDESGRSRTYIRFSGTAQQVRRSFSADIHNFMVNGERQFAPATAVTVPAALAPLVRVVRNLDSYRPKAPRPVTNPLYVYGGGNDEALAPGDLAVIYDFQSLRAQGYDGTGQSIAVVGQTDISLKDLAFYRQSFGLPAAAQTGKHASDISSEMHLPEFIAYGDLLPVQAFSLRTTPLRAKHGPELCADHHFDERSQPCPGRIVLRQRLPDARKGFLFQMLTVGGRNGAACHRRSRTHLDGSKCQRIGLRKNLFKHGGTAQTAMIRARFPSRTAIPAEP
jgi:hypothetical protein